MKSLCYLLLLALFSCPLSALAADRLSELNIFTEEYPPFNFSRDNKLQGMSVDLLVAAAAQAGSSIKSSNIKIFPWTRAYTLTLHGKECMLFSTTRTAERESLFHWVGPITPIRLVLIARKDRGLHIDDPAALEKLSIGVVRDDIGEVTLTSMGLAHRLQSNASTDLLLKMMERGRIDAWAYEETVARWLIKEAGMNFDDYEVVYVLKKAELYFAFSLDVGEQLRQSLQRAVDKIKASDGKHSQWDTIRSRYLD